MLAFHYHSGYFIRETAGGLYEVYRHGADGVAFIPYALAYKWDNQCDARAAIDAHVYQS